MSAAEAYAWIPPTATELEVHFYLSWEQQGPGKGWAAALSTAVKNSQQQLLIFLARLRSCWGRERVLRFARIQELGSWGEGFVATGDKGAGKILGTCLWLASLAGLMKRALLLIPTTLPSSLPALLLSLLSRTKNSSYRQPDCMGWGQVRKEKILEAGSEHWVVPQRGRRRSAMLFENSCRSPGICFPISNKAH